MTPAVLHPIWNGIRLIDTVGLLYTVEAAAGGATTYIPYFDQRSRFVMGPNTQRLAIPNLWDLGTNLCLHDVVKEYVQHYARRACIAKLA